jgi:hypothetical protein
MDGLDGLFCDDDMAIRDMQFRDSSVFMADLRLTVPKNPVFVSGLDDMASVMP